MQILITGASGSGTTTLGRALANSLGYRHLDTDDFYWLPTEQPFTQTRPRDERLRLLLAELGTNVVVSGSVMEWGAQVEDAFDGIVFLYVETAIRIDRLTRRETARFGHVDPAFLAWAAQYDEGTSTGRNLHKHNQWLAQRSCPILRFSGDLPTAELVARASTWALNPTPLPT